MSAHYNIRVTLLKVVVIQGGDVIFVLVSEKDKIRLWLTSNRLLLPSEVQALKRIYTSLVTHAVAVNKSSIVHTLFTMPASIAGVQRKVLCIRQKL